MLHILRRQGLPGARLPRWGPERRPLLIWTAAGTGRFPIRIRLKGLLRITTETQSDDPLVAALSSAEVVRISARGRAQVSR